MEFQKNKGFTLVELIVVIAIIGILVAIAVPRFATVFDSAKITADKATLRTLNNATTFYSIENPTTNDDIFDGISDDSDKIQALVNGAYLADVVTPQKDGETFDWNVDSQKWLYSLYAVAGNTFSGYDFSNLTNEQLANFLYYNKSAWNSSEEGYSYTGGSEALLFIPNNNDEYTITTTATLGTGNGNGYGILFETTVDDTDPNKASDTGYVLQFDRGWDGGSIIIRERNNGNEVNPDYKVKSDALATALGTTIDANWWTEEHEISLNVTDINDESTTDNKSVSVSIDGIQVIDSYTFVTDVDSPENNYTGFRSWNSETTYQSMTIE